MKYFIYARKSSEGEERQILSIEAQLAELREFAAKEKMEIVASVCEAKTAKEPGRTKFAEMLESLEKGQADGILSWHPDRLARNSIDGGKIIYFLDTGKIKSLKFPTFWFENTPQGKFMLGLAFGQSKYYVDNLSENVKRGMRQKIRNGVWPGLAPLGYANNPKTRNIDVDPETTKIARKLFDLYSTGEYPLQYLVDYLKDIGVKSRKGKQYSVSCVQKILQNPFYYGVIRYKGEIFPGSHDPLVSKTLFDEVQRVMGNRSKKQRRRKHEFPFIGLIRCAFCGCSITAEI